MSTPTLSIAKSARSFDRIRSSVGQVIVGQAVTIDLLLAALLTAGHVLLEDVPGLGKTLLAKTLARTLDLSFRRVQFTPDLMPTDLTGLSVFDRASSAFVFRPGPIETSILLADEINRATPRTQAALLESMEEHQVTVDGVTRPLPRPFLVLATQNPVELEGTFPLPEAQLDRFLLRLHLGYPSEAQELEVLRRHAGDDPLLRVEPVLGPADIDQLQQAARSVRVSDAVASYIVQLVQATRREPSLRLGASPRASLALYRTCQAWALIRGRDFVLPDDVKGLAHPVLEHRCILDPEAELRGISVGEVVNGLLATVAAPVEAQPPLSGR